MELLIRLATLDDALYVHQVTQDAYREYQDPAAWSSALSESVEYVANTLSQGTTQAILCQLGNAIVGAVRFQVDERGLYFSRLSVSPQYQGRGIAKVMLHWLEDYATAHGIATLWCKARRSVPRNMHIYESIGYTICAEETLPLSQPGRAPLQIVTMCKPLISAARKVGTVA